MAQSVRFHEQAERCRSLARAAVDPALRDSLLKLADEYSARANAEAHDETAPGGQDGDGNDAAVEPAAGDLRSPSGE